MKSYRKYFVGAIRRNYPETCSEIILQTDANYLDISADTKFSFTSKNPLDRRLDFSAYFLALIKTLDQQGNPFEMIRRVCLEVAIDYVKPKSKIHAFVKRLLPKLVNTWLAQLLIKRLKKKISKNENPSGFIAEIITDKKETYGLGYGIDILECGICKLFHKHNYDRYSSILCEVDKVTSGLAGLKLKRTGTIANGAKKCDFRFIKESFASIYYTEMK